MAEGRTNCVRVVFVFMVLLPWICDGVRMNDTKTLHTKLLTDYNKDVRPVLNQTSPVYVNVSFSLMTIQSLDEVTGLFTFVGIFSFSWIDESMVWNPDEYGGTNSVFISQDKVWMPDLILQSVADEILFVGRNAYYKIRYIGNKAMLWPTEKIESSCSVNVRKYPFDKQNCLIYFFALGYFPTELEIVSVIDTFSIQYYIEHAEWELTNTAIYANYPTLLTLDFQLKRKSTFVVINVLLPITLLCLLNVLVFLLVPESGERISYCITVLLAISVFMTIISDTLPKSSQPVPIISYKLMIDVIISMLITVVTILNLRLHNKDDEQQVPSPLKTIYRAICCRTCKQRKSGYIKKSCDAQNMLAGNPKPDSVEGVHQYPPEMLEYSRTGRKENLGLKTKDIPEEEQKITWKNIGAMIDAFAFIVFTTAIISSFFLFIFFTMD